MFSYLHSIRPNNRRTSSHASTPQLPSAKYYHEASAYPTESPYDSSLHRNTNDGRFPSPSPVSPVPPILPPIPRVTLQHDSHGGTASESQSPAPGLVHIEGKREDCQELSFMPSAGDYDFQAFENQPTKYSERSSMQPLYPNPIAPHQFHDKTYLPINTSYDSIKPSAIPPQNVPRPISTGSSIDIPQPHRPPPPPPTSTRSSQSDALSTNPGRHGRTKLNLLNPRSLMARRRSSQVVMEATLDKAIQTKNSGILSVGLPDDYDPRIRGKVVHDFSAPRLGRTYSPNDTSFSTSERSKAQELQNTNQRRLSPNLNSFSSPEEDSPNNPEREHTPIFKEHFDDDIELRQSMRSGTAKHGASTFMYQVSLAESHPDPDPSSIPAFARNLPARVSTEVKGNYSPLAAPKSPPDVGHETNLIHRGTPEVSAKPSPPISSPKTRSRASSNSDPPFQSAGLPRHFKSDASRFSFDLAGVGSSAQEKLLEERHRLKAKQNAQERVARPELADDILHDVENDGDSYNYEDIDEVDDDDDAFEERIPGVNADDDEDPALPVLNRDMESFHFTSPAKSSLTSPPSPMSTDRTSLPTPQDYQNQPIGFTTSKLSPSLKPQSSLRTSRSSLESRSTRGLALDFNSGISPEIRSDPPEGKDSLSNPPMAPLAGLPLSQNHYQDDDFYFDDGMIEDLGGTDTGAFDESVFDDDTSRKYSLSLRVREPTQGNYYNNKRELGRHSSLQREEEASQPRSSECNDRLDTGADVAQLEKQSSFLKIKRENRASFNQATDLTQNNLAAYHDALVFATNRAALNGEFNRRQSSDTQNKDGYPDDVPGMTPDDGRGSQEINDLFLSQKVGSAEDFDFDDELSDDPIIAAANAEALENDDDGFYGQEFGFFARATGSGEYANGGYFGPHGVEGIGRSHSGRVNFQEPSLTPITERSEWSNRNSAISLGMLGYPQSAQPALPSPGLAQLADMLPLDEDNMSLSALMKLRRGAWGGSTTSLHSSSGSQISGSSLNILPTIPSSTAAPPTNSVLIHNFTSTHSLTSSSGLNSGSDSDASPSSPTITVSTNNLFPSAKSARSESSPNLPLPLHNLPDPHTMPARPRSSHLIGKVKGHSRNNSGAESVSYVHETDAKGSGGIWVVERRRLGEDGTVEVLEREVLEGGRI